ncbi:tetratricopeptide repeat protein [Myxococcota bacterium]|nr:tetratricopeptide repeat protein [Myxococcota bacterium]
MQPCGKCRPKDRVPRFEAVHGQPNGGFGGFAVRRARRVGHRPRAYGLGLVVSAAFLLSAGCATTGGEDGDGQSKRLKAQSHFNLGVDHLENGRPARGLREMLAAEDYSPEDPRIQYGVARAYLTRGKIQESEAHLLRSIDLEPGYHEARLTLSGVYMLQKRYGEAAEHTQALIDDPTFPDPWRAFTNLGWIDIKRNRLEDARESLELALEYRPNDWQTLLNLGILEASEGMSQQALGAFQRALKSQIPPSAGAELHYRIAEIYVMLGERQRAVKHLEVAIQRAADDPWGQKSEAYLSRLR